MLDGVLEQDYVGPAEDLLGRGYAFIGAVHSLVDASRSATKLDLVLAAASHALKSGDKTVVELRAVIDRVWPGAQVDLSTVQEALGLGQELGLLQPTAPLGGGELWQLTARGLEDVQHHSAWTASLRSRAVDELRTRATNDLGVAITLDQAELWLERIVGALILGITSAQDAYLGRVDHLVNKRLAPRKVDRLKVLTHLETGGSDPAIVEFLKTAAIAALDPLDPFCGELVSHITTGCVLHSYVAGREAAPVLESLGSPSGQRALLDTPVLLELLGPQRVRKTAEVTIRAAVAAGWEVMVCEHSLEELSKLVSREIPEIRASFTRAYNSKVKTEWLARLSDTQLTSYAVEVLKDGTYKTLEEMITGATNMQAALEELGVQVRYHHNDGDQASVEKCRSALDAELEGTFRSTNVIQRDAESMAVVWRRRRREKKGSQWPGGWIITPDRHLAAAFKTVDRDDRIPVTLSLSQWSTLLSVTVAPAEVVSLAEAAATQLVEESMWLLPSRYPSDVALELAERLSTGSGASETEIRYAQLSLDVALDQNDARRTPNAMAADVLSARTIRRERFAAMEVEAASRMVADAQARREAAQELAESRADEAAAARKESVTKSQEIGELQGALEWQTTRVRRVLISALLAAVGLAAIVAVMLLGTWPVVPLAMLGALGFGAFVLYRWCTDPQARLVRLAWTAVVEGVGIVASVVGLISDVGGAR